MVYNVLTAFKDKLDGKIYYPGDKYTGKKTKARIADLTSSEYELADGTLGPFIEPVDAE
ncbi:hypothetical protein H9L19_06810 [Weissella diestrammenae]|uniref:Uncharacterized protein n=2 Tax=Weissella diestrammenae TaxID=1162633 RepID=A0A7G9T4Q4_9LACO|nr:hypothetical protein [Weissella diestrammenae]QNN75079.1 hypothetical protein H9L19_06810 [Weissella diestrammenae]